jgi:hypothetical protein
MPGHWASELQVQVLLLQVPLAQTVPQFPQLLALLVVSTQLPLQLV